MKKDKRMQTAYQKRMEEKLIAVEEQILNDSLTNPLLERAGEVPDYYKTWIDGSKLVAVLPALNKDHPDSRSYYSVGVIKDSIEDDNIRVSPVHMLINEKFYDVVEDQYDPLNKFFLFDTESSKLYAYEKMPHSQKNHLVKKADFAKNMQYIIDHPVVLFFKGCDDGHVGKRFKTQEEAFEYLQMIEVFEDIFDEELQYHN